MAAAAMLNLLPVNFSTHFLRLRRQDVSVHDRVDPHELTVSSQNAVHFDWYSRRCESNC